MSKNITWLIENKVILVKLNGLSKFSHNELFNQKILALLDSSSADVVHYVIDASELHTPLTIYNVKNG